jgi:3-oxoacyl-[acyl-carrier protein] reductase
MSLKGKVALVTGASSVPGDAIALALAKAGAKVAVEGAAGVQERVLRTVETFGGDALPVRGSLTNESDVAHILSNVEAILGPVDILVNASGARLTKSLAETSAQEWDQVAGSKARAAFLCAKAIIPGMKQRGGGHIISVGSAQGLHGQANATALCASEHALIGFNNALAQETAGSGVKVSLVTSTQAIKGQDGPDSPGMDPDEVARGVVFLASQEANATNAQLVVGL